MTVLKALLVAGMASSGLKMKSDCIGHSCLLVLLHRHCSYPIFITVLFWYMLSLETTYVQLALQSEI